MSELVLLRHGATDWSASGKHTGRTDVPLNEDGERQAELVGTSIRGRAFVLVLTSPLARAKRTAELAGLQTQANARRAAPEERHWRTVPTWAAQR